MSKVAEYLEDAAHYIDADSRAIVEPLNDDEFAILVAASDALNEGCAEPGIDNTLIRTHEALADFDASRTEHWSQKGYREELALAAPAVKFEEIQLSKGHERQSFIVVDFGDYRVVLK